eukprot:6044247-Amphidinium_carterae.2
MLSVRCSYREAVSMESIKLCNMILSSTGLSDTITTMAIAHVYSQGADLDAQCDLQGNRPQEMGIRK